MPFAQLANPSTLTPKDILCDLVEGINSITPLRLAGDVAAIEATISWALGKLALVGLDGTTLGCPSGSQSANVLYPNMTQPGGPQNLPPSVYANTGNNAYNKTYFCTAPTKPKSAHTC